MPCQYKEVMSDAEIEARKSAQIPRATSAKSMSRCDHNRRSVEKPIPRSPICGSGWNWPGARESALQRLPRDQRSSRSRLVQLFGVRGNSRVTSLDALPADTLSEGSQKAFLAFPDPQRRIVRGKRHGRTNDPAPRRTDRCSAGNSNAARNGVDLIWPPKSQFLTTIFLKTIFTSTCGTGFAISS